MVVEERKEARKSGSALFKRPAVGPQLALDNYKYGTKMAIF